jgi:hypothetical protein
MDVEEKMKKFKSTEKIFDYKIMNYSELKISGCTPEKIEALATTVALCDTIPIGQVWRDYRYLKMDVEEKMKKFKSTESLDFVALYKLKESILTDSRNDFKEWRRAMEIDENSGMGFISKTGIYDWTRDAKWIDNPMKNEAIYQKGCHMDVITKDFEKNHTCVKAATGDFFCLNKADCQVWIMKSREMKMIFWELINAQENAMMNFYLYWDEVKIHFPDHELNLASPGYISDNYIGSEAWLRENLRECHMNLCGSVMVDELKLSSIGSGEFIHSILENCRDENREICNELQFVEEEMKNFSDASSRAIVKENGAKKTIKIKCQASLTKGCNEFHQYKPVQVKRKAGAAHSALVDIYIWFFCWWYWLNTGTTIRPQSFMAGRYKVKTSVQWLPRGFKILLMSSLIVGTASGFCSDAGNLEPCLDPILLVTAPTYNLNGNVTFMFGNVKSLMSFQIGNFSDYRCYIGNVRSAICETYVARNMTEFVNCDDNFSSQRGCSSETRNCFCEAGKNIVIEMDENLNEISFHDFELIGIEREQELLSSFSVSHQTGLWNYTHHYDKEKKRYEFRSNNLDKKTVLLRKRACFDTHHNITTKLNVEMGECFQKSIGPVFVTIMNGSTVVDTHNFRMKEYRRCDDYPAMFSSRTNFHCHDSNQQALYIIFWILFGIACISSFVFLLSMIKPTYEKIKEVYCKAKDKIKRRKNKKNSIKMEENRAEAERSSEIELDNIIRERNSEPERRTRNSYLSKMTGLNVLTVFKICLLISGCYACDRVVYTDSSVTSCSFNSVTNTQDCVPNQMISLNFDYAGQTLCLNLQDSSNKTLETYKITLDYVKVFLESGPCYYTADWALSTQTHLRCKATSFCDTGSCGSISYDADHSMSGEISNPNCLVFPGQGACEVHDTSNPFTCGSAENCYYWCAAIVPNDAKYKFCMIDGYGEETRLTVSDNSGNYLIDFTFGSTNSFPGGSVDYHGLFSLDFDNILPSYYNIYSDEYITSGSERGSPEINKIGDIQANDPSDMSVGDFIFANGVITGHYKDDANDEIVVDYLESGFSHNNAPKIHDGNTVLEVWSYNGTLERWEALVTRTVGAQYSILFDSTFMVSEQVNEVCPVVEDVSDAAGCFDCDSGMAFNITAHSQCLSGSVQITCDSLEILNPLVDLIDSEREFEIYALAKDARISSDCKIGDVNFHLDGELSEMEDFDKSVNNVTASNDNKDNDACEGDFIAKTFNGCGKWYDILGTVLLIIALIGALIVGIIALLMLASKIFEMFSILMIMRNSKIPPAKEPIEPSERWKSLEEKAKSEKLSWKEAAELRKLRKGN